MKHFLLFYDVVDAFTAMRQPFRDAHLAMARAAHQRGELMLAGALADPPDGAVLLFKTESAEPVKAFAAADPYVVNGLVTRWRVREWTTVVGDSPSVSIGDNQTRQARQP